MIADLLRADTAIWEGRPSLVMEPQLVDPIFEELELDFRRRYLVVSRGLPRPVVGLALLLGWWLAAWGGQVRPAPEPWPGEAGVRIQGDRDRDRDHQDHSQRGHRCQGRLVSCSWSLRGTWLGAAHGCGDAADSWNRARG